MKVLVADDNLLHCELLKKKLESSECHCFFAHNGFEVLELVEAENPDLILLDINMPILSGIDCTRTLKADQVYQHIPIVVMTADPSNQDACQDAGCDEYLVKPIKKVTLTEIIAKNRHALTRPAN